MSGQRRPARSAPGLWSRWSRSASEGWRRFLARDWIWALLLVATGGFALAPEGWFFRQQVEVGQIAIRNYVAPSDSLLADEDTTKEKRVRAREAVLPVYDFDQSAMVNLDEQLARLFSAGRQLYDDLAQAVEGGKLSDAELQEALLSALSASTNVVVDPDQARLLWARRFSEDLEDRVRTVARSVLRTGVVANKRQLLENRLRGVTLRTLQINDERQQLDLYEYHAYPEDVRSLVEVEVGSWPNLNRKERARLTGFVVDLIAPNVALNLNETNQRREAAASAVEPVYNQVRRGQVIVRKGDTIGPTQARAINDFVRVGRSLAQWLPWLGNFILVSLVGVGLWYGLRRTRLAEGRVDARTYGGLVLLLICGIVAAELGFMVANALADSFDNAPFNAVRSYRYAIPYASLALVASLFYGRGTALLLALCFAVLSGRLGGGDSSATVIYVLATSLAAIFALDRLNQRAAVTRAGLLVGVSGMITSLMLATFDQSAVGSLTGLSYDLVCALLGGLLVAAATSFFVPVLESLLGMTTDIKLLELADTNLPLLRRVAFEAPGTFQHSLMVANLAKAGCEAIGANAVLAYTGGLYHDIGKVLRPAYFVENQMGSKNPHDELAPSMSCLIVVSHVKDGAEMARENGLPEPIIDAIEQHHGSRKMSFFLSRARELNPDGKVEEHEYRYPGPKPQSKVMGILMYADAVEAASRTLKEPTRPTIQGLLKRLLDDCVNDGQLDETDLTLSDLRKISDAFQRVLETIHHRRIDYPGYEFNRSPQASTNRPLRVVEAASDASAAR